MPSRHPQKTSWGSAAFAAEGRFTVEIDEAIGRSAARLNIDSPAIYVSVELADRRLLHDLLEFLSSSTIKTTLRELTLKPSGVQLLRDDEPGGRIFLVVATATHTIRLTLLPDDLVHLALALSAAIEQLT